ncbi:MAG: aspartyl protease family protein [Paraburkholderia sp.]|jgi:hypothetical protein|uniref:aspartyl protease family protein n=1 Tax=Burkholderiaceae TaxID=119060 RepID=UPI0010F6759E|nr:aspartyl protease family protein [Burkholderia sp. 4M9327F10]
MSQKVTGLVLTRRTWTSSHAVFKTLAAAFVLTLLTYSWAASAQALQESKPTTDDLSIVRQLVKHQSDLCQTVEIEGTVLANDMKGRFQVVADPASRTAAIRVFGVGPENFSVGVANEIAWISDRDRAPRKADFIGFRQGLVDDAYWAGGGLANRCWPADVAYVQTLSTAHDTLDELAVVPAGGKVMHVWVSRATRHVVKWTRRDEPDLATTSLTYCRDDTLREFACRQTRIDRDGNRWVFVTEHIKRGVSSTRIAALAAWPGESVQDHWIENGQRQTTVPMTVEGQPMVDVFVNGHGPIKMIVDTGGSLMLTARVAALAKLKRAGHGYQTGVTGAAASIQFVHVDDLRIGSAHIENQFAQVLDGPDDIGKSAIGGTIGYEVLSRFRSTFDFEGGRFTLASDHDAAGDAADPIPFTLDNTVPGVQGQLNGVPTSIWIDTGNGAPLFVAAAFTKNHPSAMATRLYDVGMRVGGIGDAGSPALLGVVRRLSIGTRDSTDVVGIFTNQRTGPDTNSDTGANAGTPLFSGGQLTIDYSQRKIWASAPSRRDQPFSPFYNHAGFGFTSWAGNIAVVKYVRPDSPAAEAGLSVDDKVFAINGEQVSDSVLGRLHSQVASSADTPVTLSVVRDKRQFDVEIRPRPYVQ